MLKSFFCGFGKTLYKSSFPQQSRFIVFSSRAFFAEVNEEVTRYQELRHISKILGVQYFKHNREIAHTGDVRLLDEGNKLLGIYNIEEARRKCDELKKDIVMTNINARPPICKAYDYKDDLYKKFVKEVVEKDLPKFNRAREKAVESKSLKLGPKMNVADLKNKIVSAQEIAKKFRTVRVYMKVTDETEESGRNVIFTFRDLGKSFLRAKGEIQESSENEEGIEEVDDEGRQVQTLSLELQSLIFAAETEIKNISEEELKEIIQIYVKRSSKRSAIDDQLDSMIAEGDADVKGAQEEYKQERAKVDETMEIRQDLNSFDVNLNSEADRYYKEMGFMNEDPEEEENPEHVAIREDVEELRMRYGGNRDEAMYHYLLGDHVKRLNRITNMMKIKKMIEKKKKEKF